MKAIPTYALYGEADEHLGLDWLHCETIFARSRLHEFRIKPHRHEAFYQILYLERGDGEVTLDGHPARLEAPCLVMLPALVVHSYSFSRDVEGLVLTLFERRLPEILRACPEATQLLEAPHLLTLGADPEAARTIGTGLATIWREFQDRAPARLAAIEASVVLVLVAAHRIHLDAAEPMSGGRSRALHHIASFRHLVDRDFRRRLPIAAYARQLSITETHLNRLCREQLSDTALGVVNARIMLEAKRCLIFTSMSIKETAAALGFEDAAYFTRFFRRESGLSPLAFREFQHRH